MNAEVDGVVIDTSAWIDHFRKEDEFVIDLLESDRAWIHPGILLELSMGEIPRRAQTIRDLARLPSAREVGVTDCLAMVENHRLKSTGIGAIDAQLLAACLSGDLKLLTHDRSLKYQAEKLGVYYK